MSENENPSGGKREDKPNKPNKPKLTGKALILHRVYVTVTVIAALIVAGYVGWNLFSAPPAVENPDNTRRPQVTTTVDPQGNVVETMAPELPSDRKAEFYTVLIIGQDTYGGGNTDTMMLAAYDAKGQAAGVMSLPRDTYVNFNGRKVLLNSVYNRAGGGEKGIRALKEEVQNLTGVQPDFHVIIQWEAVGKLVDAIDGVEFNVPRDMYYNDPLQHFVIDLKKGLQHLDGDKAMQLIRWRHNSDKDGNIIRSGYAQGDLGRVKTQQDFLKAVLEKCLKPEVLLGNLTEYVSIFLENVNTDMTAADLAYFGKSAIGSLDIANVSFMTMPCQDAGDGIHVVAVEDKLIEAINAGFNPYLEDIRPGELDLVPAKPKATAKPNAKVTAKPDPSAEPAAEITDEPTDEPSAEPTGVPTDEPTGEPSEEPSAAPSDEPTDEPTPSVAPTAGEPPEAEPTGNPTEEPTPEPTPTPEGETVSILPPMPTPVQTQ